ncbi:D-serine deaminase, pyridoxal phosphate-dependent [Promicromonospora umidemergens]|uniref:Amino acid deaminase/aldolase n=1 Tax=Promicromonospora umidemergens TaxID=629679 RepID=A0ABP8WRY0_9MICO|nr:alanine racemase [Promicromonospora umidemergens]MCP2283507.1 D-serine deaminase, pyridoxal phosphate-dependent [Promicromonospora umidemergens]
MSSAADTVARLSAATSGLPAPVAVVDLDVFDANALDLLKRADGVPVRVASKSVRVRSLVDRAVGHGFAGVMAYSLREALWLVSRGVRDVLVGYPTVDRQALATLAADATARAEITLMVDDVAHLGLIADAEGPAGGVRGTADAGPVQVCLDVDCSLRVGAGALTAHLGVRRSPLREPGDVAALATVAQAKGLSVRGLMFYEAQVAGLPDTSPAVRLVKRLSMREVNERRVRILAAVRDAVGQEVVLVNAGGTGSIEVSGGAPGVNEVTAGSGLYAPGLFDGYRSFQARPAAFFGLDVVREPAPGWVTAFSGGYAASGKAGAARLPRPFTPGYALSGPEGAGEVQTPLRVARGLSPDGRLHTGDRVWLRHAKAGEMLERFDRVHLVSGTEIVETVPTYRGEGKNFG